MAGPIVLLTDFGLEDTYVGVMKGVILQINPQATIVDLGHQVAPQNVAEGAFLLATSYRYFAAEAIFIAVVDPGVGTERRPIALRTPHGTFVGPDNGLFGMVLRDFGVEAPPSEGRLSLANPAIQGVILENPRYLRPRISSTFHGRDVFAPVAAHLSLGIPLAAFGPPLSEILALPFPRPERRDGEILGHVVHVDRFGNLITDIPASELATITRPVIEVAGQQIREISRTYAEQPGLIALVGSADQLEIALSGGSAAKALGVRLGDPVTVRNRR